MKKVLITGHLGYVGPIITNLLDKEKIEWQGIDAGLFVDRQSQTQYRDIRDLSLVDFKNIHSVIHLASLSNDPLGEVNKDLTETINFKETIRIAKLAKDAGVERFVFFSSCSVYGYSDREGESLNEESPTRPLTAYAVSKLRSEEELVRLEDDNFFSVCLRFGTAYGVSPNMRSDLVVNNLMGTGFFNKKIEVLSDGTPWRPLIHVQDMANAVLAVLIINKDLLKNRIFNVGSNVDNFQIKDIANVVSSLMPEVQVEIKGVTSSDNRSYCVDFSRFHTEVSPKFEWSLLKGSQEILDWLIKNKSIQNFLISEEFVRVKKLKALLDKNLFDENLYVQN